MENKDWRIDANGDMVHTNGYRIAFEGLGKRDWYAHLKDKSWFRHDTFMPVFKAAMQAYESAHMVNVYIPKELYHKLIRLGIIDTDGVRSHNVGNSNYAKHVIQPWAIWLDWDLNNWDGDIVKRVLRTKDGESRRMDYEKIIHDCEERIRQIKCEEILKDS